MTPADEGLHEIADRLLAYLREEMNDAGVGYVAPPASLLGGQETRLFRFKLAGAPREWSVPLVLRVFAPAQPRQRAEWEAAVQNSLAALGYPAPPVLLAGADDGIGGPFVIMHAMPGETLMTAEAQRMPGMLGAAHAALHELDTAPLMESLRARGIDDEWFRYGARLQRLSTKRTAHPWLAGALRWLVDNRPAQPERLSVCHGDFHPLNILVQDGEVSAVVDWSGFAVADPVMDVAFTDVVLDVAGREVFPAGDLDQMLSGYFAAYDDVRPFDATHLGYYRTLRCVMALIEGAEGQDIWARPSAVARLTDTIWRNTGIQTNRPLSS